MATTPGSAGRAAYIAGEPRTSNPHSDSSPEFQAYDDAWLWARQCDNGEGVRTAPSESTLLYVDALRALEPHGRHHSSLLRAGLGCIEPINPLPGASETWVWNVSSLIDTHIEVLARWYARIRPDCLNPEEPK